MLFFFSKMVCQFSITTAALEQNRTRTDVLHFELPWEDDLAGREGRGQSQIPSLQSREYGPHLARRYLVVFILAVTDCGHVVDDGTQLRDCLEVISVLCWNQCRIQRILELEISIPKRMFIWIGQRCGRRIWNQRSSIVVVGLYAIGRRRHTLAKKLE